MTYSYLQIMSGEHTGDEREVHTFRAKSSQHFIR